jgi:hypothetical protein
METEARPRAKLPPRQDPPCPVCRRPDRVDRVSNVVKAGTGRLMSIDGQSYRFQTDLARMLCAPERPVASSILQTVVRLLVSIVALVVIMAIVTLLRTQGAVEIPPAPLDVAYYAAIAWFAIGMPAWALWRFWSEHQAVKAQEPSWQEARSRWARLYYCTRDDVVYMPGEKRAESPEQVDALLYRPSSAGDASRMPSYAGAAE